MREVSKRREVTMNSGEDITSVPSACLKAFLLYDDFTLARRAKGRLEEAAAHCVESNCKVHPWRADLLDEPALADAALADALDAELMLLALGHTVFLPSPVQRWLEVWAACRSVPDAALALLTPPRASSATTLLASELEALARRHGLTWLASFHGATGGDAETSSAAMLADLHQREHVVTPVLRDVLAGPVPYRFFGLNE